MKVEQLSIFLENKSGRLSKALDAITSVNVNIRALSLADTSEFGILRLIVDDLDKAKNAIESAGFTVKKTDVIAIQVPDKPGGLANILNVLSAQSINIEYMYAFVEKASQDAVVIFRIEKINDAIEALKSNNIKVLTAQELYSL